MLRNIDSVVSPELLDVLFRMGHGDEIVLADAFFPGDSCNSRVIRADGIDVSRLLAGICPLITLDSYVDNPLVMMQPGEGDSLDEEVEADFMKAVHQTWPEAAGPARIGRFEFYERARNAFAVVMSGEVRKYGNIIIKKGVINR
ncbi:MAG: L-fucose mutarotase [Spirochaetales bacterium]|nr:L-fucose mutarotase [Spirochaetales bacterium]